ncbi:CobD/CbiB family cobalamin biosynthesis protein [Paraburkholderia sp.]|uniref:CobD/CbiB family cobalamin biosynthesis protein n=1 Tax=Paraburkholderia sp. TaxID=1926495 RepID=UPI0025DD903C|nr:CobD/CbiB family cobalamin biosynthesis protein [Paraburkholderia sp.]
MIAALSASTVCILCFAGVILDAIFGEPSRFHPLVGFGRWATCVARACNPDRQAAHASEAHGHAMPVAAHALLARLAGVAAWALAVIPPVVLLAVLTHRLPTMLSWTLHVAALWFALGARSLIDHIAPVEQALRAGDLAKARALTARVVTRDLSEADEPAVARAAIESALENGNDAIFGALFWFAVAGGPGVLAFRLVNTLDAMWGYRTPRFRYFGWAAARLDDAANFLPARLTALTYALCGNFRSAVACWRTQASAWDSPNAGPVMASGAGSLNVACGGAAWYHGVLEARPALGCGHAPGAADVGRALSLVKRSIVAWLAVMALLAAASALV